MLDFVFILVCVLFDVTGVRVGVMPLNPFEVSKIKKINLSCFKMRSILPINPIYRLGTILFILGSVYS